MPQPAPTGLPPFPADVRPLAAVHLAGLMAVQEACYGAGFLESSEVFGQRLASPANCSLVAVEGDAVLAYLAAYRSVRGKVTALHGGFETPARPPDTLCLHDMAVHPDCAGRGLAGALLEALWRGARTAGLRYSTLVSVQGSRAYWERRGYAVREPASPEARERLAGYGAEAVYMERVL